MKVRWKAKIITLIHWQNVFTSYIKIVLNHILSHNRMYNYCFFLISCSLLIITYLTYCIYNSFSLCTSVHQDSFVFFFNYSTNVLFLQSVLCTFGVIILPAITIAVLLAPFDDAKQCRSLISFFSNIQRLGMCVIDVCALTTRDSCELNIILIDNQIYLISQIFIFQGYYWNMKLVKCFVIKNNCWRKEYNMKRQHIKKLS